MKSTVFILLCLMGQFSIAQEMQVRLYDEAQDAFLKQEYRKSKNSIDSAILISPERAESYFLRAQIYSQLGQPRAAIRDYDQVVLLDPKFKEAYYNRSIVRHSLGDHIDYALNDINESIRIDPRQDEYYHQKSIFLGSKLNLATGISDFQAAIETISTAIELNPLPTYYNERGLYKFKDNQSLAALSDLTKAIEMSPNESTYYSSRGLVKLYIEDFEGAKVDYTAAIVLNSLSYQNYLRRAHCSYNLTSFQDAISDYSTSINLIFDQLSKTPGRIKPSNPLNKQLRTAYLFRGTASIQSGNRFSGCDDFKRAWDLGDNKASNYMRRYCN